MEEEEEVQEISSGREQREPLTGELLFTWFIEFSFQRVDVHPEEARLWRSREVHV